MTAVRIDTAGIDLESLGLCVEAYLQAQKDGKSGVVIAQISMDSMTFELIEHEWATKINAVLAARKQAIDAAHDLLDFFHSGELK